MEKVLSDSILSAWNECIQKIEKENFQLRGGVTCVGPGNEPKVLFGGKTIDPKLWSLKDIVNNRKELKKNFRGAVKEFDVDMEKRESELAGLIHRWLCEAYVPSTLSDSLPQGNMLFTEGENIDGFVDLAYHFYDILEDGPVFVDGWRGFLKRGEKYETFPLGVQILYAEDLKTASNYTHLGVSHIQLLDAVREMDGLDPTRKGVLLVGGRDHIQSFSSSDDVVNEEDRALLENINKVNRHLKLSTYFLRHSVGGINIWDPTALWDALKKVYGDEEWIKRSNVLILQSSHPPIFTHIPVTLN